MVEPSAGGPRVDPSLDYLKSFMLPNRFENFERLAQVKGRRKVKVKLKKGTESINTKFLKLIGEPVWKELLVKGSLMNFWFFGRKPMLR